jgi:hypothetical protein
MVQHIKDDAAQYMLIRLPDKKDENETIRDVFIGWTGPQVKRIQAAKIKSNDFEFCKETIRVSLLVVAHILTSCSPTTLLWKQRLRTTSTSKQSWTGATPCLDLT